MTKHNLTPDKPLDARDRQALLKLAGDTRPRSAFALKAKLTTMNGLARRGYVTRADMAGSRLDPRYYTHWTITPAGIIRARELKESTDG